MAATITAVVRESGTASISEQGLTESVTYIATVTEEDATDAEVVNASHGSMPAFKSGHPIYPGLVVNNKTATRRPDSSGNPSRHEWNVQVDYTQLQLVGSTTTSSFILVKMDGVEEVVLTQENKGTAVVPALNSVGDPHEPWETYLQDAVYSISYETDAPDFAAIDAARGKVNDAPVVINLPQGDLTFSRTFPQHSLLMKNATINGAVSRADGITQKWKVDLTLIHRPGADGWKLRKPQKGYRWFATGGAGSGNVLTKWQDHAAFLDADGLKLAEGSQLVMSDPIQRFEETDLNAILEAI